MKKLVVVFLSVVLPSLMFAQVSVSGTVTDASTGDPLVGANVFIDELSVGAAADIDGRYSFTVPQSKISGATVTITARYIGYKIFTAENISLSGAVTQDIALEADILGLEEIVVTGVVSEMPATKLPFSVGRLRPEELLVAASSAEGMLRGKIPGVKVIKASGRPGTAASVQLRGPTSLDASGRSQDPLFIVDGVIIGNTMADIDARDIVSIHVVKGAAAASIYGSRAAHGVVQITTNRGKSVPMNTTRVKLRTEFGFNQLGKGMALLQNHSFLQATEAYTDANGHAVKKGDFVVRVYDQTVTDSLVGTVWVDPRDAARDTEYFGDPANKIVFQDNDYYFVSTGVPDSLLIPTGQNFGTWTDNQPAPTVLPAGGFDHIDDIFDPGSFQTTTISVAQNSAANNFFASFSHSEEPGVMYNLTGNTRNSIRVNLDHTVSSSLKLSVSTYYAQSIIDDLNDGGPFFDLTFMPPDVDLFLIDETDYEHEKLEGQWSKKTGDNVQIFTRPDPTNFEEDNPVYPLLYLDRQRQRDRFLTNVRMAYNPFRWFGVEANLSIDRSDNNRSSYWQKGYKNSSAGVYYANGRLFKAESWSQALNADVTASFRGSFGDLNLTSKLRYLYEEDANASSNMTGWDFAVGGVPSVSVADEQSISSSQQRVLGEGYYFIGGMDFGGKYIADFMIRKDGSSLFGSEERWHNYYRYSAAYRISEEPFWVLKGLFNEFKIRFSRGTAGSRPRFSAQYETYNVSGGQVSKGTLGNSSLIPEFATETEIGLDFALLDRFSIELTSATSIIENQIMSVPLNGYAGFSSQYRNAGTLESKTLEASLDAVLIQTRNLGLSMTFNWDKTDQEITEFNLPAFKGGPGGAFYYRAGEEIGTIYGDSWLTTTSDLATLGAANAAEFDVNDDGLLVWVGTGKTWRSGIADALWGTSTTFYNTDSTMSEGYIWGMPILWEDSLGFNFGKIGVTVPDFNFGFGTNMRLGNLDIYALFEGQVGGKIYNHTSQWGMRDSKVAAADQGGKADGDKKPTLYYQTVYDVNKINSYFIEDGTYMKLQELSVRYSLSIPNIANRITLGLVGRNLLTWTNYSGYDPEVGSTGSTTGSAVIARYDDYSYPNFRTFSFLFEVEL